MKITLVTLLLSVFYFWKCQAWLSSSTTRRTTTCNKIHYHQYETKSLTAIDASSSSMRTNDQEDYSSQQSRRMFLGSMIVTSVLSSLPSLAVAGGGSPRLDVNNALAREYTGFPGLYPTIATKLVNAAKEEPFKSKKDVYKILNEVEQDRLKQYDSAIVINPVDRKLQQFKTSQICKYECGGRGSSAYRDEQIKEVQKERF